MRSLPFPLRVATGLAVTTIEQVRHLPRQIIGLPVLVAGQTLQISLRVQQQLTELAIKGDNALSTLSILQPTDETPQWATFDEDLDENADSTGPTDSVKSPPTPAPKTTLTQEPQLLGPAGLANYDELSLPQLRSQLRKLSLSQLEEALAYEGTNANRPSFVGMLARRIKNVQKAELEASTKDKNPNAVAG